MNLWKKIRLPLSLLVVGTATVVLVANSKPDMIAQGNADQPVAKIKVRAQPIIHEATSLSVISHGTVTPRREIDIVAQVSGQIVAVENQFANGGAFERNQTLLHIDERDYQIALMRAKAELATAQRLLAEEQGRHRHAKEEWRNLGDDLANALFLREPQLAEAQAGLEAAKANVSKAELDIARTKIAVPFDGRIKETYVNLGQYVTSGVPLARVYDSSAVELRLPLSDKDAALLALPLLSQTTLNQTAAIPIIQPRVSITGTIAGQVAQWQGKIVRTDAFIDSRTRSFFAIVEVENPFADNQTAALLPGLFVSAEIQGKRMEDVIMLPHSALFNLNKVYVLDTNHEVVIKTVEVLRKTDEYAWVRSDTADNTLVVLEKQSLIHSGMTVDPVIDAEIASVKSQDETSLSLDTKKLGKDN